MAFFQFSGSSLPFQEIGTGTGYNLLQGGGGNKQVSADYEMKIALNIEAIGARHGGAEKYASSLARWLVSLDHDVHVFVRIANPEELGAGVTVHRVKPFCPPGLKWLRSYLFARASEQALRKEHFDLIIGFVKVWYQHVYLAVGGAHPASLDCSSKRYRSPWLRMLWRLGKLLSIKQWVFRAVARRQFHSDYSPHIIAPARLVAEHFQRYHSIEPERISVVYNALDESESLPDPAAARDRFRRAHGLSAGDVAVLFVARNYVLKGLEPLLHAFNELSRKHPSARLIVCGSKREARYRRMAEGLGLEKQVLFLGFVDDVRECFAGCDIFAFPTFYDPCSLVVLEAMKAGLPVITTRQNGAGELVTEGVDGYVVQSPWEVHQMADRLSRLVGDESLRKRMGEEAKQNAQAFTLESRRKELLTVLYQAAEGRSMELDAKESV